jgi:hypothetical protein
VDEDAPWRRITVWTREWAICRLAPDAEVPDWARVRDALTAIVRTASELSITVPAVRVPLDVRAERGFRILAVAGPLPFAMSGVMAAIAGPLGEHAISLVPIGTYDTDYVLVKDVDLDRALQVLATAGWQIAREQVSGSPR